MTAIEEIAAERKRQIEKEGWDADHDDGHHNGDLALAAASYALSSTFTKDENKAHKNALYGLASGFNSVIASIWPRSWDAHWFKPKNERRDLIRAGALIVAQIERIDRDAAL